jgi:hypothetical protein
MEYYGARAILFFEDNQTMRTVLMLVSALTLPALALAGPPSTGHLPIHNNHRAHFATGIRWAHSAYRGYYCFNGVNWVVVPLAFPYGGLVVNGDFVYQGREVSDDVYPYAQPTSNPDIVISPFALNNLVDVTGIPPGAKVRDPVSEEIFLRP